MADLMTVEQAAQYLRLSADSVRRKARNGELPAAKVGRGWRFSEEVLKRWIEAGGTLRERLEDEGIAIVLAERKAKPNPRWTSLEDVERGLGL